MKSAKPVPKVGAMGVSGVIATLIIWAMSEFGGVDAPPEMSALFTTIIVFIAGYMMPDNRSVASANVQIRDDDHPASPEPAEDAIQDSAE